MFGTLRRMEWLPYTYDQQLGQKDMREKIGKHFGRSAFLAFTRMGDYLLKVLAWRSGTGAVSLAMNSDCTESDLQIFDFCFKRNGDAWWYKSAQITQDERNLKAFSRPCGVTPELTSQQKDDITCHLTNMSRYSVKMLTCRDLGLEWFIL